VKQENHLSGAREDQAIATVRPFFRFWVPQWSSHLTFGTRFFIHFNCRLVSFAFKVEGCHESESELGQRQRKIKTEPQQSRRTYATQASVENRKERRLTSQPVFQQARKSQVTKVATGELQTPRKTRAKSCSAQKIKSCSGKFCVANGFWSTSAWLMVICGKILGIRNREYGNLQYVFLSLFV